MNPKTPEPYDALLLVSFGGPEGPDDVAPFLQNVVRDKKNIPPERLIEVARHYERFDGVSPLNAQNRSLLTSLVAELNAHGPQLPVYWGNRHWHPLLTDVVRQMADDGVRRALALVTSAFGSPSGCRQYREDLERARQQAGPDAPSIDKLRLFYNHPGFLEATADRVAASLRSLPPKQRSAAPLVFTAHSIPTSMADRCPYERQVRQSCQLAAEQAAKILNDRPALSWRLAFQSRSGPPSQTWLGPELSNTLRHVCEVEHAEDVVVAPIGFLAENMEVVYDLDVEAQQQCDALGLNMTRAAVVGNHPRFVRMIRELIVERLDPTSPRSALGPDGPWPDDCPSDCCPTMATSTP
ncbi:MAG: ferrochelatase [Planctomycetaceae bacterium]|nr:ferrochelatase [Planctomycetaceae bacterium]